MITIGILGSGRVVKNRYLEVFLDELKGVSVAAVCDLVASRADEIASQLRCLSTQSYSVLLENDEIDAVVIATESGNHYEHSLAALSAGKHVIVEKPPAMFPDQVEEVEKIARQKGLMYAVIFQNRYNPAMVKLKETFQSGRFGKIVLATVRLRWCRYQEYYEDGWHGTWKMDGGVINQQAIHHLDALQWICGPVDRVCSAMGNALNDLEAEDTMVGSLQFQNGALGVIEATTAARPIDFEASLSIVGEKGTAVIGGIALNKIDMWDFVESFPEDSEVSERFSQEVPTGYGLSHGPLMQDIVDRISQGRSDPPISGSDTVSVVRLVHGLYKSVENNCWVKLSEESLSSKLGR